MKEVLYKSSLLYLLSPCVFIKLNNERIVRITRVDGEEKMIYYDYYLGDGTLTQGMHRISDIKSVYVNETAPAAGGGRRRGRRSIKRNRRKSRSRSRR
jgi:hypothetical protein